MEVIVYYLIIVASSALFCIGLVVFLKRPFFKLVTSSVSQLNVVLDDSIKEEQKDKQLLQNLTKLLGSLILCVGILFLLTTGAVLLPFLYLQLNSTPITNTYLVYSYGSIAVGSLSLLVFKKKGNYSYWSRLLHTIVLDNYALGRYLLTRELEKSSSEVSAEDQDFLIITGLARSGTTALTNLIFDEKKFHSIKYSNVPFLLSPNLWKKIYHPRRVKQRERAHQDKVLFSEESIEALEEYFFKVHLRDNYVKDNYLVKHQISKDLLIKYYKYQNLFIERKETIYLAKNNNFLLRYESIRELNSRFIVILIFRNPIEHAQSLLNQHNNFIAQQEEDDFVLTYMNWLCHHEFGLNQKHFDFFNENLKEVNSNKKELSFWIEAWINYYSYIIEIYNPNQKLFLVHYEDLALSPNILKKAIGKNIGIKLGKKYIQPFKLKKSLSENTMDIRGDQLKKAYKVYHKLLSHKIQLNEYDQVNGPTRDR